MIGMIVGNGDNTGWPDHVGIVTEVNGNTFKVIEGIKMMLLNIEQ